MHLEFRDSKQTLHALRIGLRVADKSLGRPDEPSHPLDRLGSMRSAQGI